MILPEQTFHQTASKFSWVVKISRFRLTHAAQPSFTHMCIACIMYIIYICTHILVGGFNRLKKILVNGKDYPIYYRK